MPSSASKSSYEGLQGHCKASGQPSFLATRHFLAAVEGPRMLTSAQAASALNTDPVTVRRLFDLGELQGIEVGAGRGLRKQRRFLRPSVALYLLRNANYEAEAFLTNVVLFLNGLPLCDRTVVHDSVTWHEATGKAGGSS